MRKPLRLLIFGKDIDGGTGTFLLNLLPITKTFKKGGVSVKTTVLERPDYLDISREDIAFRKARDYRSRFSISIVGIIDFFCDWVWFTRHIVSFKPDVVVCIDSNCNLIAEFSKLLLPQQFKTILTTHIDLKATIDQKATLLLRLLLTHLVRFFYNRADALVCVSNDLAINLAKDFRLTKSVHTIYNGLTLREQTSLHFTKSKKNIILSVARLDEQKDHETLIRAFSLLAKKMADCRLWIASDGPKKQALRLLARRLGIAEKVRFLGWIADVHSSLRQADIFVLASKREGFSYALLEAMCQGKPVIATDTPYGPSEVLGRGKYGILVPMGDAVSLKDAVLKLLRSSRTYTHFAKQAFIRSHTFSQASMLRRYKHLILSLLPTN